MDKFQVYDRSLQTWVDGELVNGWQENFVLDKTTDSARIKVKYKGTTMPNWKNGDWCRILHLGENETGATYTMKSFKGQLVPSLTTVLASGREYSEIVFEQNGDFSDNIQYTAKIYYIKNGSITYKEVNFNRKQLASDYVVTLDGTFDPTQNTDCKIVITSVSKPFVLSYSNNTAEKRVYIPKNHDQYVIKNINMVVDKVNDEIDIQLTLGEPIEITNGINLETKSFTNQVTKQIDGTTYFHEKLNHFNVLRTLLKITPANENNEKIVIETSGVLYFNSPTDFYGVGISQGSTVGGEEVVEIKENYVKIKVGNNFYYALLGNGTVKFDIPSTNKCWANKIKVVDSEFLESINYNDETLSEQTLYGVLLNKFDSSTGRTPVLYFDINGTTDKPYDTETKKYFLQFERQDGIDKTDVQYDDLVEGCSSIVNSQSDDNFTDGLISNFDNLISDTEEVYPSEVLWALPDVDTPNRSLTGYNQHNGSWGIKTPHKIKNVKSITRFLLTQTGQALTTNLTVTKDVKKNYIILEKKQYEANTNYGSSGADNYVWYEEGSSFIHLNEAIYSPVHPTGTSVLTGKMILYKVVYNPLISGRYDLGEEYQTQINQTDGQIDNAKFGKYLKEYFNSMNKTDITITKTVESYADIKELGSRVIKDNKIYLITTIGVEGRGFDYNVTYQLNENHMRKSDSVEAPQSIRQNIEIGINATKERKSMLSKKCKLSMTQVEDNYNVFNIPKQVLFSSLLDYNSRNYPQIAQIYFKDLLVGSNNSSIIKRNWSMLCQLIGTYLNDTICLNMKYYDNAEAGYKKEMEVNTDGTNVTIYGSVNKHTPIIYTNGFGEFKSFDFKLYNINDEDLETIEQGTLTPQQFSNKIKAIADTMATFPETTAVDNVQDKVEIASEQNIIYEKDMLDIFNYSLGIKYETDHDIILGSAFFLKNILLNNTACSKKVYMFNKNMTEEDFKREVDVDLMGQNVSSTSLNNGEITLVLYNSMTFGNNTKSIVIGNTDDAVLIINNADKYFTAGQVIHQIKLYC